MSNTLPTLRRDQHLIGITGGIATGKSTVSGYLADTYHLPVLDADVYARDAVQSGSPILSKILERYGAGILLADNTLNRQRLGEIVFSNPAELRWLEQQIHPLVRSCLQSELNLLSEQYPTVVLVVPLLFEAGMTDLVTEIWVVYCERTQQLQRLVKRLPSAVRGAQSRLTLEQATARINSQMPIEEKIARADVVIDNSSTREALLKQVDAALKTLEPF